MVSEISNLKVLVLGGRRNPRNELNAPPEVAAWKAGRQGSHSALREDFQPSTPMRARESCSMILPRPPKKVPNIMASIQKTEGTWAIV